VTRKRKLLVVTPRELTRDVRARRQVEAALRGELEVVGLSGAAPGETPVELSGVQIFRVRGDQLSGGLRKLGLGGMRPSRAPVRELRGLWRLVRLAKTTALLVRAGRRLGRFDLVHVNDFDALPAGALLARSSRARLVYDAHELYRYMESDPPRVYSMVAALLESRLARRASVVTNCDLFARELERLLRLPNAVTVVLNCPDPIASVPAREPSDRLRVIYQAAADYEARPLGDLIEAAQHAPDVDITIRVVQLDRPAVEQRIRSAGVEERVRIVAPVEPDKLVEELFGFDVGVIINRDVTPNSTLSVPGKLWEYGMAGLATVAPASAGLLIVDELGVGLTFPAGEPAELGRSLQQLADDRALLTHLQTRARELALTTYNSEAQAEALRAVWS
jgi:glycosyltransferase involved in cell wall biosynthesis